MVSLKEEWSIPAQSPHIRGRKKEQLVSPSSTPIIDSVSGRCRDSTPRLGWEFMEMRFLLCTVDSSSKLLPISDSIVKKKGKKRIHMMQLHCNIRSNPRPTSSHTEFFPRHLLYPFLLFGQPVLQWMENTMFTVLNLTMVGSCAGLAFSLNNSHCVKTQAACNKKT